jgi:thiamine monophosphate synthase
MRYLLPIIACCLLLAGCSFGTGVDRAELDAQLKAGAEKIAKMEAFIQANKPLLDQLAKLAADTKDPDLIKAAEKLRVTVEAVQAALPTAKAELETVQATVQKLEADAAGKVPWYAIAGGLALHYVPRIAATFIPALAPLAALLANVNWTLSATKAQKDEDALIAAKAAGKA